MRDCLPNLMHESELPEFTEFSLAEIRVLVTADLFPRSSRPLRRGWSGSDVADFNNKMRRDGGFAAAVYGVVAIHRYFRAA